MVLIYKLENNSGMYEDGDYWAIKVKIIAKRSYSVIIDDGDYWLIRTTYNGKVEDERILKTDEPFYPLQMILKWDYETVVNSGNKDPCVR